jgi:hypothetical protein
MRWVGVRLTADALPDNSDQKTSGAASRLVGVRKNWPTFLNHDLLSKWQSWLSRNIEKGIARYCGSLQRMGSTLRCVTAHPCAAAGELCLDLSNSCSPECTETDVLSVMASPQDHIFPMNLP